jgi:hypothetical protein
MESYAIALCDNERPLAHLEAVLRLIRPDIRASWVAAIVTGCEIVAERAERREFGD